MRVKDLGFRAWDVGFRAKGLGFGVWDRLGLGYRDYMGFSDVTRRMENQKENAGLISAL